MAKIYEGDREIFRALTYSHTDRDYQQYVHDRYENLTNLVTGSAKEFMSRARDKYERVINSGSVRKARALARQIGNLWGKDCIQPLHTITDVQNAPYSMRQYIMAEPTIRKLYHQNQCEGYGSSYVDNEPGVIGSEHLAYQKVDNGYVHVADDGSWSATTYSNNFEDDLDSEDLTLDQQDDIRSVWDIVRSAIYFEVDPTSKRDADL